MADQNHSPQYYSDLGASEALAATTDHMVPISTNHLTPVVTNYQEPVTSHNYSFMNTVAYSNAITNHNIGNDGDEIQEEIFDQNVVTVSETSDNIPLDMSVPLDMSMKKVSSFEAGNNVAVSEKTDSNNVEMVGKEFVPVLEDEEYGETLQKCPICHKMFMKSDYDNFHINTHKTDDNDNRDGNAQEKDAQSTKEVKQNLDNKYSYVTQANGQNVIKENEYVKKTEFENVTQAVFQNLNDENIYVTTPSMDNVYDEGTYVTQAGFQTEDETYIDASVAELRNINQEALYATTDVSAAWENLQTTTSVVETRDTVETTNAPQTVEYEYSAVPISSSSFFETPKNELNSVVASASYNPYNTHTTYSQIATTYGNKALDLQSDKPQGIEFPCGEGTNQNIEILKDIERDGMKQSENVTTEGEYYEISISVDSVEAESISSQSIDQTGESQAVPIVACEILPIDVKKSLSIAQPKILPPTGCITLPTTVLDLQNTENGEPIAEHLSDRKVIGLTENVEPLYESNKISKPDLNLDVQVNSAGYGSQQLKHKPKANQIKQLIMENNTLQVSESPSTSLNSVARKNIIARPKIKPRITISTQTEGTFVLPKNLVPDTTECDDNQDKSYLQTETEDLEKSENHENVFVAEKYAETALETYNYEPVVELQSVLNEVESLVSELCKEEIKHIVDELYRDQVKAILNEIIEKTIQLKHVEFKSSLDCGIFLCSKCPEMFETDSKLKNHLETDHCEDYENFTVFDLQKDTSPPVDVMVIEDELEERSNIKNKTAHSKIVEVDTDFKAEEIENSGNIGKVKKVFSSKTDKTTTVSVEGLENVQPKTPQTKTIQPVQIMDTASVVLGKRKRSINKRFDSDFIVDIDIIDDEVKPSKKHNSESDSPRKGLSKQKKQLNLQGKVPQEAMNKSETQGKKDKPISKPWVKAKANAPFFARLAIQRKLLVLGAGLRECPICYRRVYGQLGLKSHMEDHRPVCEQENPRIPENTKQNEEKPDSKEFINKTNKTIVKERTFGSKSETSEKSKSIIQEKLTSIQANSKGVYECPTCNHQLQTQKGLLMHIQKHKSERESTPDYEGKKIIQEKLVSLGKDLHECPICSRIIAGKYPLKIHMNTHRSEEAIENYKEINKKGKTELSEVRNSKKESDTIQSPVMKTNESNSNTEQTDSGMQSTLTEGTNSDQIKKTVIQEKLANIVGGELHECPICSRLIYGKVRLEAHLKTHSPVRKITEEVEQKTVAENDTSPMEKDKSGNVKHDSKDELVECPECSKKVLGQHRLLQHMKAHKKNESLKGNLGRLANQRKEIIEKRRSQEAVLECPQCSKEVHGQHRLAVHLKTHEKDDDDNEISFNLKSQTERKNEGEKKRMTKPDPKSKAKDIGKTETVKEVDSTNKNSDGAETSRSDTPRNQVSSRFVNCTVCLKLQRKEYLQMHMERVHSSERPYVCKICSASFVRKYGLTRHELRHSNKRDFKCTECFKTFVHKDDLRKHSQRHYSKFEFQCKDCKHRFMTNGELRKHQKVHMAVKEHHCNECGKSFSHYYQLIRHQRLHRKGTVTVAMKHSCTKCGKMFATRSLLESHLPVHNALTRARATKHACRKCGKRFAFRHLLESHMPVHSEKVRDILPRVTKPLTPEESETNKPKATIPKLVKSPELIKPAASKPIDEKLPPRLSRASTPSLAEATPQIQVRATTPENDEITADKTKKLDKSNKMENDKTAANEFTRLKPNKGTKDEIVCEICDLKFKTDSDLVKHKQTHNSAEMMRGLSTRKTSCKICGKSFNFKASLMQHLKAHSEVRDFSCQRCGKYFPTNDILSKHVASHKNSEFSCAGCKKKFLHGKSLKDHLKRCPKGKRETRSLNKLGKK